MQFFALEKKRQVGRNQVETRAAQSRLPVQGITARWLDAKSTSTQTKSPGTMSGAQMACDLSLAESPAYCGTVFRYPVGSELEVVVDVAYIDLRPNEKMRRGIESHASRGVHLEVIGAIQEGVVGTAAGKFVAGCIRQEEAHISCS